MTSRALPCLVVFMHIPLYCVFRALCTFHFTAHSVLYARSVLKHIPCLLCIPFAEHSVLLHGLIFAHSPLAAAFVSAAHSALAAAFVSAAHSRQHRSRFQSPWSMIPACSKTMWIFPIHCASRPRISAANSMAARISRNPASGVSRLMASSQSSISSSGSMPWA